MSPLERALARHVAEALAVQPEPVRATMEAAIRRGGATSIERTPAGIVIVHVDGMVLLVTRLRDLEQAARRWN